MLVVSEGCVELIVDFVICFGDNEKNLAMVIVHLFHEVR